MKYSNRDLLAKVTKNLAINIRFVVINPFLTRFFAITSPIKTVFFDNSVNLKTVLICVYRTNWMCLTKTSVVQ